jgi:hypothetical protein
VWHAASIAADDARKARASDRIRLTRLCDIEYSKVLTLGRSIKRDFAKSRGWSENKRGFSIRRLQKHERRRGAVDLWHPEIDHPDYFDAESGPAGIVTHSYSDWPTLSAFARQNNLRVERLPFSWYSPLTTAVLLTAPLSG